MEESNPIEKLLMNGKPIQYGMTEEFMLEFFGNLYDSVMLMQAHLKEMNDKLNWLKDYVEHAQGQLCKPE